MSKHMHLSLNERIAIQIGLENGASRSSIAKTLGKDRSTIAKEIKKRRKTVYPKANRVKGKRPVFDCVHMEKCGCRNVCRAPCDSYEFSFCMRRDKKVGVVTAVMIWKNAGRSILSMMQKMHTMNIVRIYVMPEKVLT